MSKIIAVIGANYGDEGKGYMTDYFCHREKTLGNTVVNILGNGGGQRGHTVETQDGKRFIFHHLGAGAFEGTDQYFSPDYIINPLIFLRDYEEFFQIYTIKNQQQPRFDLYMSPECRFSTPFDMMTNQIIENDRGSKRHGSVGVGIWETVRRYEKGLGISVSTMHDYTEEQQIHFLMKIKNYFENRIKEKTGLFPFEMPEWKEIWDDPELISHYLDDFAMTLRMIPLLPLKNLSIYDSIVVENAQGVLLGQNLYDGTYDTTPSDTGAKEIQNLLDHGLQPYIDDITLCYVTRSYITKHGAGLFENECTSDKIAPGIVDLTNMPNPFQGTIRYAKMKEEKVIQQILRDEKDVTSLPHHVALCVTHINEFIPDLKKFTDVIEEVYISDGKDKTYCKRLGKDDIINRRRV